MFWSTRRVALAARTTEGVAQGVVGRADSVCLQVRRRSALLDVVQHVRAYHARCGVDSPPGVERARVRRGAQNAPQLAAAGTKET